MPIGKRHQLEAGDTAAKRRRLDRTPYPQPKLWVIDFLNWNIIGPGGELVQVITAQHLVSPDILLQTTTQTLNDHDHPILNSLQYSQLQQLLPRPADPRCEIRTQSMTKLDCSDETAFKKAIESLAGLASDQPLSTVSPLCVGHPDDLDLLCDRNSTSSADRPNTIEPPSPRQFNEKSQLWPYWPQTCTFFRHDQYETTSGVSLPGLVNPVAPEHMVRIYMALSSKQKQWKLDLIQELQLSCIIALCWATYDACTESLHEPISSQSEPTDAEKLYGLECACRAGSLVHHVCTRLRRGPIILLAKDQIDAFQAKTTVQAVLQIPDSSTPPPLSMAGLAFSDISLGVLMTAPSRRTPIPQDFMLKADYLPLEGTLPALVT